MKALARFEELLQQMVEAPFRRVFGGRLEPVDLARRLGRVMDDNKRVTWERPLVPNQYAIALAPKDFEDVQGFVEALQRELERFVAERAAERRYSLLAAPRVTIGSESALSAGVFTVRATMIDAVQVPSGPSGRSGRGPESAAGARRRERRSPPRRPARGPCAPWRCLWAPPGWMSSTWWARSTGGTRPGPSSGKQVRIGRGLDNEVVLDDASVSRHHAEITREDGALEVRDLGSTNGTWVNAGRVDVAAVEAGDQIAFGAVHLEVARRPEPSGEPAPGGPRRR